MKSYDEQATCKVVCSENKNVVRQQLIQSIQNQSQYKNQLITKAHDKIYKYRYALITHAH